jgi:hypothetical protein
MASGEDIRKGEKEIEEIVQKLRNTMSEKMDLYGDIQNEFSILANEVKDHKRGQQFAGAIIALAAGMEELYGITNDLANAYARDSVNRIRDKT